MTQVISEFLDLKGKYQMFRNLQQSFKNRLNYVKASSEKSIKNIDNIDWYYLQKVSQYIIGDPLLTRHRHQ